MTFWWKYGKLPNWSLKFTKLHFGPSIFQKLHFSPFYKFHSKLTCIYYKSFNQLTTYVKFQHFEAILAKLQNSALLLPKLPILPLHAFLHTNCLYPHIHLKHIFFNFSNQKCKQWLIYSGNRHESKAEQN